MIKLNNIRVTFNRGTPLEKVALRGINLSIEEGEFLTIIGSNGAGKSTLMSVLSGDIRVDEGSIVIDNVDVTDKPTEGRAGFVSRVFQNPMVGTCSELTIEENLALALGRGKWRGLMPAITQKVSGRFRRLVAELGIGLETRLKDPIKSLSGGQRQAVSLLMTTLQPSKILLLDEHTAALDPKMAKRILELSQKLIDKHGLTALMITHSMHQALECGTRTILMHEGLIAKDLRGDERNGMTPADLVEFFESQ